MPSVTWLGHSTVLIEAGGLRLLTDPVLRPRVAHLTRRAPAVDPRTLGSLDAVLLSHVHRDHLDVPTLRKIAEEVPVVGPVGVGAMVGKRRVTHELEPGEELALGGTTIRATPAVHEVRRRFRGVQALGFVAERIYFAGDTELFDGMRELGPVDTALLPVWGWGTSLGAGHMDPEAAAEAAALIRPAHGGADPLGHVLPRAPGPGRPPAAARPATRLRAARPGPVPGHSRRRARHR